MAPTPTSASKGTFKEATEAIAAGTALRLSASETNPATPLTAWGFDPIYFGGERMTVQHLDRVGNGRRPIVVAHANGHLLNANSAMLQRAGITADTEVEGVMKYTSGTLAGQPNGELQEPSAMYLVFKTIGGAGLQGPMTDGGLRAFGEIGRAHV